VTILETREQHEAEVRDMIVDAVNIEQETAPDATDVINRQDDVVPESQTTSGTALGPEDETPILPTSPALTAFQEQLVSRQEEVPPASPAVLMPTTREPEPSPTTGLAPRSASQQSLDVQTPRTEPTEEEDLTDEDSYGLYEDLPSVDYGKHSHISLEDLEGDAHPEVSAGLVSQSTIEGIVLQLFPRTFLFVLLLTFLSF
jgi:hypothetical protein